MGFQHIPFNAMNRINRYIMECKYNWEPDGNSNKCELIDTLWNVNDKL